jgi:hypothetical protein
MAMLCALCCVWYTFYCLALLWAINDFYYYLFQYSARDWFFVEGKGGLKKAESAHMNSFAAADSGDDSSF